MLKSTMADLAGDLSPASANQAVPVPAQRSVDARQRALLLPAAIILGLLIALYYHIAIKLAFDWYFFPDQSHGLLIPFFILFLLWMQREVLLTSQVSPSWSGMWALGVGLTVLLIGVFGADLFLSRISFLILTSGLIWALLGWPFLLRVRFMLFVAFLAIPLPALILNQITFPLQLYASKVATALLVLSGVPVLRDGNVLQLPAMQLEVAEACSGIRSLMSLLTVAVIFGYFMERTTKRRVILALASIPIAIAANAMRIFGTGLCVQYWDPEKAMGFFHEFSGWVMFLVSLSCLYIVHKTMLAVARRNGRAA
jgi:exosortase